VYLKNSNNVKFSSSNVLKCTKQGEKIEIIDQEIVMDRPHDPVKAVTKKKEIWRLNLVYKSQLSIKDVFPNNYVVIV
jgi:hypothetical protein